MKLRKKLPKRAQKRLKTTEKRQLPDSPGLGYSGEEVPRGELQSYRAKVKWGRPAFSRRDLRAKSEAASVRPEKSGKTEIPKENRAWHKVSPGFTFQPSFIVFHRLSSCPSSPICLRHAQRLNELFARHPKKFYLPYLQTKDNKSRPGTLGVCSLVHLGLQSLFDMNPTLHGNRQSGSWHLVFTCDFDFFGERLKWVGIFFDFLTGSRLFVSVFSKGLGLAGL